MTCVVAFDLEPVPHGRGSDRVVALIGAARVSKRIWNRIKPGGRGTGRNVMGHAVGQ